MNNQKLYLNIYVYNNNVYQDLWMYITVNNIIRLLSVKKSNYVNWSSFVNK